MACTYIIDPGLGFVYSRGSGVITAEDLLSHTVKLAADTALDPSFRQVVDFRAVAKLAFGIGTIREVARINPFNRTTRRAFVLGDDLPYGVIRMYLLFLGMTARGIEVFREMAPAIRWLGYEGADAAALIELTAIRELIAA